MTLTLSLLVLTRVAVTTGCSALTEMVTSSVTKEFKNSFKKLLTNPVVGAIIKTERTKEITTMKITNISDCPFTPDTINGKKVRRIFFNKYALAF